MSEPRGRRRASTFYERVEDVRGHKVIRLGSGRLIEYWGAVKAAESARTSLARAVSRAFKLAGSNADGELAAYELERLEWFVDRLEWWMRAVREEIEKRRGSQTVRERIALLRNTKGRTPGEAAAFRAKADELERRLDGVT